MIAEHYITSVEHDLFDEETKLKNNAVKAGNIDNFLQSK